MDPDKDDDETTFGEFMKYFERALEKGGSAWLDKVRPTNSSPDTAKAADPIAEFFRNQTAELQKELKAAREQMEAMREHLTPEAWTLLKSQKTGGKNGGENPDTSGQPNSGKPLDSGNSPGPVDPPPPPPKRKRNWL